MLLSELASNTAVAAMAMPIAAGLAAAVNLPPLTVMAVAALAASAGFALPIATPPNAIVYGSGRVRSRDMLVAGLVLDVVAVLGDRRRGDAHRVRPVSRRRRAGPPIRLRHVDARVVALRWVFRSVGVVAPATAARWAEAIFCRPPHHETRPARARVPRDRPRRPRAARRPRDRGWTWGEQGPLVLLMHGWGSRASRFRFFVPALVGAGFRVVAFDGPGHGQTGGTRASLPEFAAALTAVAHATGEVAGVIGHSLGGAAALFAMSRGLRPAPWWPSRHPPSRRCTSTASCATCACRARVRDRIRANLEARFGIKWSDLDIPAIAARNGQPMLVIHDREDDDVPVDERPRHRRGARAANWS